MAEPRSMRATVLTPFVALLLAAAPVPAIAASGSSSKVATPGGAPALAASAASPSGGGARYDVTVAAPARRPVASSMRATPRELVAGAAPQIRFSIRQRGMAQVQARIVVLRLPRNVPVARISLGWVKTRTDVSARLPAGVRLQRGRYIVRLHAKDSRGHILRRSARNPGRARIVVHAAPKVLPPANTPIAVPTSRLPAPAPSPGGRGVFPVAGVFSFGGVDGRFGAGRTGHIHEGQDILAAAGLPVVAPYAGTVSSTSYQAGGAGEYVVLDAVDGRDYFFAHCIRHSTVVARGALVVAGQPLCQVGQSGDATGPHLHFEIWVVGWRVAGGYPIDPLPELRAWAPG
jgi:murein DD-endopeptidase MepM/ murein hydrolase activator NlpD